MPGRPILRDAFAGGMVFSAALVGALGGSLFCVSQQLFSRQIV